TLDGLILESNYDPTMLKDGGYPVTLKRRIAGPRGHISNEEAAELLRDHGGERLQAVLLAHLSENNNCPELALSCHQLVAADFLHRHQPHLSVAPRSHASPLFSLVSGCPSPAI
ncbi:MAG: MBL fold metallo-hydrolase, partial [Planctomycetota bacterium]